MYVNHPICTQTKPYSRTIRNLYSSGNPLQWWKIKVYLYVKFLYTHILGTSTVC